MNVHFCLFFIGFLGIFQNAEAQSSMPSLKLIPVYERFNPLSGEQRLSLTKDALLPQERIVYTNSSKQEISAFRLVADENSNTDLLKQMNIPYKKLFYCKNSSTQKAFTSTDSRCNNQQTLFALGIVFSQKSDPLNRDLVLCQHPITGSTRTTDSRKNCENDGYLYKETLGQVQVATETLDARNSYTRVIPYILGRGAYTKGGQYGRVIEVTSLAETNTAGTLRHALLQTGPRVIVFKVSGDIILKTPMEVFSPNVTILGETAPSMTTSDGEKITGVTLRGAGLIVRTSEVIIRHLKIRVGDRDVGQKRGDYDAITVFADKSPLQNIVIDHNSLTWAIDETIGINGSKYVEGVKNISITHNIIAEGLMWSCHSETLMPKHVPHSMGILAWNAKDLSIIANLFANNNRRNPAVREGTDTFLIGNIFYNFGEAAFDLLMDKSNIGTHALASLENNFFIPGEDSNWDLPDDLFLPKYFTVTNGITPKTGIYLSGNRGIGISGSQQWTTNDGTWSFWDVSSYAAPIFPSIKRSSPTHIYNNSWKLNTEQDLFGIVGAHYSLRDSTDKRIIDGVKTRTGRIISTPPQPHNRTGGCD